MAFVGREQELGMLHRWLGAFTRSGTAQFFLVEGEAGIGKTSLVDELEAVSRDRHPEFLRGTAREFERTRPFAAFIDALGVRLSSSDPARVRLAELLLGEVELLPGLVAGGPNVEYLVSERIVAMIEARATAGPLVLVLEDAHWGDASTLRTTAALAHRLAELPLGLLVTFRPLPRPTELDRLIDAMPDIGGTHLRLGPIPDESVDALVFSVTGATAGPELRKHLSKTRGNPLYILELLSALGEEGSLHIDGEHAEVIRPSLPPDLPMTLLRRLRYLGDETVEVLRIASVLGSSFDVEDVGVVLRRSTLDLLPFFRRALTAGVLREDGQRLAFRHDLIRDALYEDLPKALRSGVHTQIGQTLAAAGAPALTVAHHLRLAAKPGDHEAVRWLHRAGVGALVRDPTIATELLRGAVELAGPFHPGFDEIVTDLAQATLWSGHVSEAGDLAHQLLDRDHDPSVASRMWTALLLALLSQGRTAEAHDTAQRALRDPDVFGPLRAQLQACAAHARSFGGDLDGALAAATEAHAEGTRAGDDLAVSMALCAAAHALGSQGHVGAALAKARDAAGLAARDPSAGRFHSHLFFGHALSETDRLDEAAVAIDEGRGLSETLGTAWNLPMYAFVLSWIRYANGQWDDAVAEAEAGFVLAEQLGVRHGTVSGAGVIALVALHRNDLAAAEAAFARGQADLSAAGPGYRGGWLLWARALVEEARGNPTQARGSLEAAWDIAMTMGAQCEYVQLGPDLVRLSLAAGASERALGVLREVETVAGRMATAWAEAVALRCRGLVHADAASLERAVTSARRSPRPLLLAGSCEDAGMVLDRVGARTEAIRLLDEALSAYESLGATRDVNRVEAALRSMGERRGRRGARPRRPTTGWDSLTPTEVDVALLVAHGATNRQAASQLYKSPRTIETHVAHVLAKLAVASRSELAALVARHESEGKPLAPRPTTALGPSTAAS